MKRALEFIEEKLDVYSLSLDDIKKIHYILLENLNKISPELPSITKELMVTMKELSIVLKALQKTWLLNDESEEVLEELKKKTLEKKEE